MIKRGLFKRYLDNMSLDFLLFYARFHLEVDWFKEEVSKSSSGISPKRILEIQSF